MSEYIHEIYFCKNEKIHHRMVLDDRNKKEVLNGIRTLEKKVSNLKDKAKSV